MAIRHRMEGAARAVGRDPCEVELVAVSKTHGAAAVLSALAAGQRLFGENRVQEAKAKFAGLRESWPDLRLHLIGPLQTNKVEDAVALFDVIETVDRPKLAMALGKALVRLGRQPNLLVEVNIGREPQKAGVRPEDLADFLRLCREEAGLEIAGLMCIPPVAEDPVPHFQALAGLARAQGLTRLSMGMSQDFVAAIAAGATEIRVGSAIFGERKLGREEQALRTSL